MYAPKHFALAEMYAGHLQSKCSAESISPQFGQCGLLLRPMVKRCLLRLQWPVSTSVVTLLDTISTCYSLENVLRFVLIQVNLSSNGGL